MNLLIKYRILSRDLNYEIDILYIISLPVSYHSQKGRVSSQYIYVNIYIHIYMYINDLTNYILKYNLEDGHAIHK